MEITGNETQIWQTGVVGGLVEIEMEHKYCMNQGDATGTELWERIARRGGVEEGNNKIPNRKIMWGKPIIITIWKIK